MSDKNVMEIFYEFKPRSEDAWIFENEAFRRNVELQIANFPAFALPSIERPSALCGIVPDFGTGEVWLITGDGFRRDAAVIARQLRELCIAAYKVFNLRRIHMKVDSDRPDAKLFAEKLGFICEAKNLKNMGVRGNNIDLYLLEKEPS